MSERKLTDMAKALRLLVAVVVAKVLVLLGAVVPRQLEDALATGLVALGNALLARVPQEVEAEAGLLGVVRPVQRHAKDLLVELERLFCVLDPEHGVVLSEYVGLVFVSSSIKSPD